VGDFSQITVEDHNGTHAAIDIVLIDDTSVEVDFDYTIKPTSVTIGVGTGITSGPDTTNPEPQTQAVTGIFIKDMTIGGGGTIVTCFYVLPDDSTEEAVVADTTATADWTELGGGNHPISKTIFVGKIELTFAAPVGDGTTIRCSHGDGVRAAGEALWLSPWEANAHEA
jgi:hypothetical protein